MATGKGKAPAPAPAPAPPAPAPKGPRAAQWMGKLHGSANEAKANAAYDKARRAAAQTILYPGEVSGKEWDGARVLQTTLGGVQRNITRDDLIKFRDTIKKVQKSFREGIRARQVIDLSTPVDRERAREQIRMAVPVTANSGKVRFMTNSGPDSKVTRHHVVVEFLSFTAATSAGRQSAKQMAGWLRKEPLKFDCDCGRHTFWYRYISTIGGFNAGRVETGFPKERNPNLRGVACKHVLRVMAEIESSVLVQNFLTRLIDKARMSDDAAAKLRMGQEEAQQLAAKQSRRPRAIAESTQKQKDREAVRARMALAEATAKAPPPKRAAPASKRVQVQQKKAAETLAAQFGLTPAQVLALLAAQQKA